MSQLTKDLNRRVMYIENKNDGEARVGWVTFSKTGRTVYYKDKVLKHLKRGGISGNHYCEETNDEYWISGVKKDMSDRHKFGGGKIFVEKRILEDYLQIIGRTEPIFASFCWAFREYTLDALPLFLADSDD